MSGFVFESTRLTQINVALRICELIKWFLPIFNHKAVDFLVHSGFSYRFLEQVRGEQGEEEENFFLTQLAFMGVPGCSRGPYLASTSLRHLGMPGMNLTLLGNSILFLHNVISHCIFQDKLSVYSQINYLKRFICM